MPRITVTLTEDFKRELETYADGHGATLAGALIALGRKQLAIETGRIKATPCRKHRRAFCGEH